MADVFISYSRKDNEFVARLRDALKEAGREAWVDTQDLLPTEEWLNAIHAALDGADACITVISPDYIESAVCAQEVTYALANRKRIIPVVCRPVESSAVRAKEAFAPLGALKWIYMRPTDDFAAAFEKVRFALDTDPGYWHLSGQLLVRARQWENRAKNASLTLRGPELAEAEGWVTQGADKEPHPSALQLSYITASRKATVSRQRRLLTGVSVALIVTLILALISTALFQITRSQNATLQQQNADLEVRALAGASGAALSSGKIDQALLLGVEASRRQDNAQTRNPLFDALNNSPYLQTILQGSNTAEQNPGQYGVQVAYSQDGKTLMSATDDGHITLWDPAAGTAHMRFSATCQTTQPGVKLALTDAALSPNGKLVATLFSNCAQPTVDLWNAATGTLVQHIAIGSSPDTTFARMVAFSPDGRQIAVPTNSGILLFDVQTDQQIATLINPNGPNGGASVAFTPDGTHLVESDYQSIVVWDLPTKAPITTFDVAASLASRFAEFSTYALALGTTSGGFLTAGLAGASCSQHSIHCVGVVVFVLMDPSNNYANPTISSVLTVAGGVATSVALIPGGNTAVASAGSTLYLIDLGTQETTALTGHVSTIQGLAASQDGTHFASTGLDDQVLLWKTTSNQLEIPPDTAGYIGGSPALYSPNGATLVTQGELGLIGLFDATSGASIATFSPTNVEGDLLAAGFGADSSTIMVLSTGCDNSTPPDCTIQVTSWRPNGANQPATPIGTPFSAPACAHDCTTNFGLSFDAPTLSPNGKYLIVNPTDVSMHSDGSVSGDTAVVWDAATHQQLTAVANDNFVAFSPDGKSMALAARQEPQHAVHVVNLASSQVTENLTGASSEVLSLAYSTDNHWLAALDASGKVTIWNLSTGKVQESFQGANTSKTNLYSMQFDPTSDVLMVADGLTITLWDVASNQLYIRPIVDPVTFDNAVFSPDGKFIAEAETAGPIIVRAITPQAWQTEACAIANRNLTQTEWKAAFAGTADENNYQKTCATFPAGS